jgi:hypothetical protein
VAEKKDFIDLLKAGNYQYKIIENAGHGVNHEQAEIVNQEIYRFIKGKKSKKEDKNLLQRHKGSGGASRHRENTKKT